MAYHLIATRTVHPTLKSARKFNSSPNPPQIIETGDAMACWHRGIDIAGMNGTNELELCLNGLSLKVTADWTYWIVKDKGSK